jgi:hypothetical protein
VVTKDHSEIIGSTLKGDCTTTKVPIRTIRMADCFIARAVLHDRVLTDNRKIREVREEIDALVGGLDCAVCCLLKSMCRLAHHFPGRGHERRHLNSDSRAPSSLML